MNEPEERDLAHEADMEKLRREQLAAEDFDDEELMGDPDEYDYEDEDWECPECRGLGTDRYSDHLMPCSLCQGEQKP